MQGKRQYYLDNIRVICILSLFIFHTCEMYHLKEGFYIEGEKNLASTLIYNFPSPWLMGVLFFIAGISTMYSLERRTVKQFYLERVKRLLIPFIAGVILIVPIQSYWTMKNHYDFKGNMIEVYRHFFTTITDGFYGYDGGLTPSHLWFLLYLIGISVLCYPIISYKLKHEDKKKIRFHAGFIAILILITYVISYGGSDESIGKFILFYVLGILLYNDEEFFLYLKNNWRKLVSIALIADAITAYLLILMKDVSVWSPDYAWMHFVWALSCVVSVFATLAVGKVLLNKSNKIWAYLSSRSFAVYFIHMTVLITVGYMVVTYLPYGVLIQSLLTILVSAVVTFALTEICIRIPVINKILGIKNIRMRKE